MRARDFEASTLVRFATTTDVPDEVLAAYDAPFPDEPHKTGVRQMTALLPLTRNDPGARIDRRTMEVLRTWDKPFLTAYSDGDPATAGWERVFQEEVPGAKGSRTSPSRARATSCRRTGARSWPPSSPTSSTPLLPFDVRRRTVEVHLRTPSAEIGQRSAAMSSAIWTALSAAPLRRLSFDRNSARPRPSGDRLVGADATDEGGVGAGRLERRGHVGELARPGRGRAARGPRPA